MYSIILYAVVLDFIEQYSRSTSICRWKWPQNALLYLRTIITDDPTHRIQRKVYPELGLVMVYNFSLPNTGLRKSCRGVITLWMWFFTDFYRFLTWISIYIFTVWSGNRLQPFIISSNMYDDHNYRVLHLSERLQIVCNIDIWSKTRKNALFHYFCRASSSCIASISMLFRVSSTLIHIYNNLEIEWGVQLSYSSSTSLWKMEIYMIFTKFMLWWKSTNLRQISSQIVVQKLHTLSNYVYISFLHVVNALLMLSISFGIV